MKRYITILALTVCVLLGVSAFLYFGPWGQAMAEGETEQPPALQAEANGLEIGESWIEKWDTAGVFGPSEGLATLVGKASVEVTNVELQNIVIHGDLYVQAGIGNTAVKLNNITVTGGLYIYGGGSVTIKNGQINYLEIKNEANATYVSAEGSASIWSVRVKSESQLEEKTGPDAQGFGHVYSTTPQTLTLSGNFPTLTVENTQGAVNFMSGRIGKVYMESLAEGSVLTLGEQTEVGVLDLLSPVRILGQGTVELVVVLADGSVMEKDAKAYEFAEGMSILVNGGIVDVNGKHVVVLENFSDVELNPGKSATKKVVVNPADAQVSVSSSNADVVAVSLEGDTITIRSLAAGRATVTVTAVKEGFSTAAQSFSVTVNTPELPKVRLQAISAVTLDPGEATTRQFAVNPADATIRISSSNTGVTTATRSGTTITVTAKGSGTATITLIAEKSGYTSARVTFRVTVSSPAPQVGVSRISVVKNSPLPGSNGIRIYLSNTTIPGNYTVTLDGRSTNLRPDGYFEFAEDASKPNYASKTEAQLKSLVRISPN